MKQVIVISRSPKDCEKILNGDIKTLILKLFPKCELPVDCYIYCTQLKQKIKTGDNNKLARDTNGFYYGCPTTDGWENILNGKIVAKFTLNKVDKIINQGSRFIINNDESYTNKIARESCLQYPDLRDYSNGKKLYAWHIDNLVVFDKPINLINFYKSTGNSKSGLVTPITKAPQSFMYAWVEE